MTPFEREVLERLAAIAAALERLEARVTRLERPSGSPSAVGSDGDPYAVNRGP